LTFNPGETSKQVSVFVNADNVHEVPPETFFVNLSNPSSNATITDNQGVGTITDPVNAGDMIIKEFRFRGPDPDGAGSLDGSLDEYIELYNTTGAPLTVAVSDGTDGWRLVALDPNGVGGAILLAVIPNGTVIPANG